MSAVANGFVGVGSHGIPISVEVDFVAAHLLFHFICCELAIYVTLAVFHMYSQDSSCLLAAFD